MNSGKLAFKPSAYRTNQNHPSMQPQCVAGMDNNTVQSSDEYNSLLSWLVLCNYWLSPGIRNLVKLSCIFLKQCVFFHLGQWLMAFVCIVSEWKMLALKLVFFFIVFLLFNEKNNPKHIHFAYPWHQNCKTPTRNPITTHNYLGSMSHCLGMISSTVLNIWLL